MTIPKRMKHSRGGPKPRRLQTEFILPQLANLSEDGISRFRKIFDKSPTWYGRYSDEELLTMRDELRMFWRYQAEHNLVVTDRTTKLFESSQDAPFTLQKVICDHWLRKETLPFEVTWTGRQQKILARPQCLPVVLAWACVFREGHFKFCQNEACLYPYYIARRKDQKYCSDECAAPAKRKAKKKWWSEHRSKSTRDQQ